MITFITLSLVFIAILIRQILKDRKEYFEWDKQSLERKIIANGENGGQKLQKIANWSERVDQRT